MNLFRSEEHARRWSEFDPTTESTLQPVSFWAELFSTPIFHQRARPDYVSWLTGDEGRAGFAELRARLP
jgi:hypothetical protein